MTQLKIFACIVLLAALGAPASAAEFKSASGAVGLEDRERMMRSYGEYNLHLAFANAKGEFLAGVRLAIRGADGRVLWRAHSEGPYYFVRLPEGRYEVTAEFGGKSHTRWVRVGGEPGTLHHFHWN